jgi:hypothetical protein
LKDEGRIYSICKGGVLLIWKYGKREEEVDLEDEVPKKKKKQTKDIWFLEKKHFFSQGSNVFSAQFHKKSGMVVVGFGNGCVSKILFIFGWEQGRLLRNIILLMVLR